MLLGGWFGARDDAEKPSPAQKTKSQIFVHDMIWRGISLIMVWMIVYRFLSLLREARERENEIEREKKKKGIRAFCST